MSAKIIAVANQKGGVTKTTTATAFAAGLKNRGFRVLLIDTDPQCNASDTYRAQIDGVATLYDMLCEDANAQEAIQHTKAGDIIPCDPNLQNAEQKMTNIGKEHTLRDRLASILDSYEYIIIDTPPAMGVLLANALTASNMVLVPITTDRYSLQGLSDFKHTITSVQKYTNPGLRIGGLLLNKFNSRTHLTRDIVEGLPHVAEMLETQLYDAKIRESIAAREAQAERTILFDYAPESTTALDFMEFVNEFLRKEAN